MTEVVSQRAVAEIHPAPQPHWVGDGFFVNPMFSHQRQDKRTDPFLMLDYATPRQFAPHAAKPRGVGGHPHKGFETITIAYQGEVAHRDSAGGGGTIQAGDVQWMTAGRGVLHDEFHSETFSRQGGYFEMVQLWLNLPAQSKHVPPRYQQITRQQMPVIRIFDDNGEVNGTVHLIAGQWPDSAQAATGPALTYTPVNLWDIQLKANAQITLQVPQTHNLLLLVRQGVATINGTAQAGAAQLVTFEAESGLAGYDQICLKASSDAPVELLWMSGVPLNEPVVGYGPFVMNTQAEIHTAIREFNQGHFGTLD